MDVSHILAPLNDAQRQAVSAPLLPTLVLAGAGSGKTRVLTHRVEWLVQVEGVSPHGILAVTFTNKAAAEMRHRIETQLGLPSAPLWIGTFHGICHRLLRLHWREAGLPQGFQILDGEDQQRLVKKIIKGLGLDDTRWVPREVAWFINAQKDEGLRPKHLKDDGDPTRRQLIKLYEAYEDACRRNGVVDFAELLLRCYEILREAPGLGEHYRARFRHVLVDEFQDTNTIQYNWMKALVGSASVPYVVGDDDQSIYRWRGARVENLQQYRKDFHDVQLFRLEQNYRSTGNILDAANAIIKNNAVRLGKNLWTDAGTGEPIRVYEAFNDTEEARWIVEEVKSLSLDGMARREMALLYRSNAQSRVLEHALFSAGLPYRVYGGLRFFERQEGKHALAYLRLIANSDDDGAFLRVVNFPARGIGARSIEQLQDAAKTAKVSLHETAKGGGKAAVFAELVDKLKAACEGLTLPETVEQVLERSGLRTHYQNEKEGQDRLANLDELVNAAANFVAEEGNVDAEGELSGDLAAFLSHASLEAGEHQAGEGDDALQLMTVHSAKGLEFDAVFISGLEEGLFPHENSVREDKGLEEERRLMYVAVTRARQRLYISHAQTRMLHGQTRYNLPSRFFDEIPEELLKWLTPRIQRAQAAVSPGLTFGSPRRGGWGGPTPDVAVSRTIAKETGGFRIGQNVAHAKFGQGVIVNAEGAGSDARVQVNFGREGVKWLALSVAKLTAA